MDSDSETTRVLQSCMISGVFAAAASIFAKAAFNEEVSPTFLGYVPFVEEHANLAVRCVCLLGLVLSNVVMFNYYVKALELSANTIAPTVINTSINVMLSSLVGYFVYNEILTTNWLVGAILSLLGLYCVQKSLVSDNIKQD